MGVSSFFAQLNLNRTLYEPKYRSNTLRAKAPFVPKRRSVRAEEAERSDRRGGAFGPKRRSVRAEEAERSRRRGGAFAPKRRSVRHGFFFRGRGIRRALRGRGIRRALRGRGFRRALRGRGFRRAPELWPFEVSQIQSHLRSLRC
ncbi:hypothetical protein KY289_018677 [Solanum tuberosum]|nr:hypothetical protein KY289_018677 [Solanum tuberosum]